MVLPLFRCRTWGMVAEAASIRISTGYVFSISTSAPLQNFRLEEISFDGRRPFLNSTKLGAQIVLLSVSKGNNLHGRRKFSFVSLSVTV